MSVPADEVDRAATLILELPSGLTRVAVTADATTIGRDARSDVAIDHPTVSRHHARITRQRGRWKFEDVGSRNGTRANGQRRGDVALGNGTELRIGRVRAWFFADGVPAGWTPDDAMPTDGKLVRCRCGHVGWAPAFVAGMVVPCHKCKRDIFVGDDAVATADAICAGCRTAIVAGEPVHTCPSCRATMHAACHDELGGCATYGCDRVAAPTDETDVEAIPRDGSGDGWTLALLAIAGLPLFGVPALAWAALMAQKVARRLTLAAIVAGGVGAVASAIGWPRVFGGLPW